MGDTKNTIKTHEYGDWIGHRQIGRDTITEELVARFAATVPLADTSGKGASAPSCLHWCLAPIAEPAGNLGPDGHPTLGLHLPPVPLSRRMWAGGELHFHDTLAVGDDVQRISTIRTIEQKNGRSGQLVFVKVRHEISTGRGPALTETQDIVYRDLIGDPRKRTETLQPDNLTDAPLVSIETDPVLLFRYSALTFNGHRIHYDHPYATGTEGYDGLVVHGPLIATLLVNLAQRDFGRLNSFHFRGQSPLICGHRLELFANRTGTALAMEARAGNGRLVMTATADLES